MDRAKLRIFAAAGGAFFGFAGIIALSIALVVTLTPLIGLAWAAVTVGSIFLAVACICFYLFLMPHTPASEEIDKLEDQAADALADLPFDTLQSMLERHPMKVATIALIMGYSVIKNPEASGKHLQRLMVGLL